MTGGGVGDHASRPVRGLADQEVRGAAVLAAVLGAVISFLVYWYLKLITGTQAWVYTDLPKGLGFHGEPP